MIKRFFYFAISMILIYSCTETSDPRNWSKNKANSFCEKNAFFKELVSRPLDITDKREFAYQYMGNEKEWKAALAFLKRNDLASLEPGKYPLTEKTFANVQDYETRTEGDFEYHKQYIDVQYMINGCEICFVAPLTSMSEETKTYTNKNDCGLYRQTNEAQEVTLDSLNFGIFFPKDAHKPNMSMTGVPEKAKKVVVKIPAIQ